MMMFKSFHLAVKFFFFAAFSKKKKKLPEIIQVIILVQIKDFEYHK